MPVGDPLPPGQQLLDALKVKHYGPVPRGDAASWKVSVWAQAGRAGDPPTVIGSVMAAELTRLPFSHVATDLHCASGWSVQGVRWAGVPASALLDRFPPPKGTVGVLAYAEYGYSTNVSLDDLLRPTTLLAVELDGAPMPAEHGHPLRLVVPHLYAHKSPKWFRGWEYLRTGRRGFWEERGYHVHADPWAEERYSFME
jgi:DMSO/TMAO reductase YedYZ molybdopterin-dependent catalytic subunit